MNYKKCMSHEENNVTEAEGNLRVIIPHFNLSCSAASFPPPSPPPYTDKKEKEIFFIYKEI
jgi:hypothetical protein